MKSILLLAGSAEARQIARALTAQGRPLSALLSEPPRGAAPMPPKVPWVLLNGPDDPILADRIAGADMVIDAGHAFDGGVRRAACAAARAAGVPYLLVQRPSWGTEAANWHRVPGVAEAMALVPSGARVFSATGWASLPDYANFPGARLLLRQIVPHDRAPPFDFVAPLFGTPPFTCAAETALFVREQIDMVICRNLGGAPSRPKIDAALDLGLPVILIDPPPLPEGAEIVPDARAALDWIAAQSGPAAPPDGAGPP